MSITKDRDATKPSQSAVNALMDSTFWVTVFGLGAIVGGVAAMKALDFREVFIIAYMILSTVAFLGIYGMHFWQFIRLTSGGKKSSKTREVEEPDTRELGPAPARVISEFRPSVTEHTTRAFEPTPTKQKSE